MAPVIISNSPALLSDLIAPVQPSPILSPPLPISNKSSGSFNDHIIIPPMPQYSSPPIPEIRKKMSINDIPSMPSIPAPAVPSQKTEKYISAENWSRKIVSPSASESGDVVKVLSIIKQSQISEEEIHQIGRILTSFKVSSDNMDPVAILEAERNDWKQKYEMARDVSSKIQKQLENAIELNHANKTSYSSEIADLKAEIQYLRSDLNKSIQRTRKESYPPVASIHFSSAAVSSDLGALKKAISKRSKETRVVSRRGNYILELVFVLYR